MLVTTPITENPWIASLFFLFIFLDIMTFGRDNLFAQQWNVLFELRNSRIFEVSLTGAWILRASVLFQYFFCCGVCLLFVNHPIADVWNLENVFLPGYYGVILAPFLWFAFQFLMVNLLCYIFRLSDMRAIFNRSFTATYVLLGPIVSMICLLLLSGRYDIQMLLILLAVLFIIAQLLFIYCLIKIFLKDIVSLCIIILYLCTLEIAPLLVLYHKITM